MSAVQETGCEAARHIPRFHLLTGEGRCTQGNLRSGLSSICTQMIESTRLTIRDAARKRTETDQVSRQRVENVRAKGIVEGAARSVLHAQPRK